jgi:TonB family protein
MSSAEPDIGEGQNALLSAITVAALELTEATGAALALKTDSNVVCLARAGENAPPLGTVLSAGCGISGECLRTGISQHCTDVATDPRVDAEASERLGVRSLLVVPLQDANGVLGILEVFSSRPGAFDESHINLLSQLGAIAFSGHKSELGSGSAAPGEESLGESAIATAFTTSSEPTPAPQEQIPNASPNRSVRLAAFAAALLALIASLGWGMARLLRGSSQEPAKKATVELPTGRIPNPAGAVGLQSFSPPSGNSKRQYDTAAEDVVVRASKVHPLRHDAPPQVLTNDPTTQLSIKEDRTTPVAIDTADVSRALAELQNNRTQVSSLIVTPSVQMPVNALPVSKGITGGSLVHSVPPTYPDTARRQKIQGDVVFEGVVDADGTVRDLSLVSGDPLLASAAKQAITQWRYSPYLLNGKAISMRTSITIRFKLPQ